MYQELLDTSADKMKKSAAVFQKEMVSLRAGRANPQLLDRIKVDYYGSETPLNQMANISSPEPRVLMISLWDASAMPLVEKAIMQSDLGLTPSNDGKVIRLTIPELNEERRKELTKLVGKSCEGAKIAVRAVRRDAMEQLKKMEKAKEITEDEQRKAEDELQKITDKAIKEVDAIAAEKEKEIMSV